MRKTIESFLYIISHITPFKKHLSALRENNANKYKSRFLQSKEVKIKRVNNLSKKEFHNDYYSKNIPVIFNKEASSWISNTKWSLQFLKENYGGEEISAFSAEGLQDNSQARGISEESVKISKIIDDIDTDNNIYIRFSSFLENKSSLSEELNLSWLKKMRKSILGIGLQSFIGSKKRTTPIHNASMAFFYIMIEGEKKWKLVDPNESICLAPEINKSVYNFSKKDMSSIDEWKNLSQFYSCTLEKDDILFVPAWYWHYVENITNSWGVSYRFTSVRGFFSSIPFAFKRLILSQPSFLKVLYLNFFSKEKATKITPKFNID